MKFVDHESSSPGTKIFLAKDPETKLDTYIFLRLIPADISKRIEKAYPGKVKWKQFPTGRERVRVRTDEEEENITFEKLCYAWCGSENMVVTPGNAEAVGFYKKFFDDAEQGKDIIIDEKLNDDIKVRMLKQFPSFLNFVLYELKKQNREFRMEEEDDLENL